MQPAGVQTQIKGFRNSKEVPIGFRYSQRDSDISKGAQTEQVGIQTQLKGFRHSQRGPDIAKEV